MWLLNSVLSLVLCLATADQQSGVSDDLHTIRVCVSSQPESASCVTLHKYFSNHSRLRVDCQDRLSFQQCCQDFLDNNVDVVSLNPKLIENFTQNFRKEAYKEIADAKEANMPLVIVKKSSNIQTILGVRVEKACLSNLHDTPSWWTAYIFSMSKANHGRYDKPYSHRYKTGLNIGEIVETDDPLTCLGSDDKGVAMLALETATNKFAEGPWRAEDYELVCWPPGGRKPITEYSTCNWYRMNFAYNSSEIYKGKYILENLVHTFIPYGQVDYFNLVWNYEGDFKVFFSDAKSAADLMDKEFCLNHFP